MAGVAQSAARLAKAKEQLAAVLVAQGFASPPRNTSDKTIDTALLCEYAAQCFESKAAPPPAPLKPETATPKKRGRPKKETR